MRIWAAEAMSDSEKAGCLRMLLSFILRRTVCGLTTKNYKKFFLMVVDHLDKESGASSPG
jgi:hypothetical protein